MRAPSRLAFVAWFVVSAGGCAAVTGLDQISEQDCAPLCGDAQATKDVTVDSPGADVASGNDVQTGVDQSSGNDAAEAASQPETSTNDAPDESSSGGGNEGGVDSHEDSPVDAPHETSTTDSSCGSTDTVQNCGACGQACAAAGTSTKSAGCGGTACLYACNTGYLDCNASVGYDPDGCECDVSGAASATCCNTACPTKHSDGLSPATSFYDCYSTGTYNSQLATDACTAYTGNSALCGTPGECTNQQDAGTGDYVVCGQATPTGACPCWEYQGPNVGKVTIGSGIYLTDCICPGSTGGGITTTSYQ